VFVVLLSSGGSTVIGWRDGFRRATPPPRGGSSQFLLLLATCVSLSFSNLPPRPRQQPSHFLLPFKSAHLQPLCNFLLLIFSHSPTLNRTFSSRSNLAASLRDHHQQQEDPSHNHSHTMAPAVGIDLGTTYSCVGIFRDDRIEVSLPLQRRLPSPPPGLILN